MSEIDNIQLNGATYPINVPDTNLTQYGRAADAKAVGDNFSKTMIYRGSASSSVNPDDYKQIGVWYVSQSVAASWKADYGFPVQNASRLMVVGSDGSSVASVLQVAFTGTDNVYVRTHGTSTGWTDWRKIAEQADIAENNASVLIYRGIISDASSSPDDLTQIGTWYINQATAQAWAENGFPISSACRMTVISGAGASAGAAMQIVQTANNRVFYRTHDVASGGAWSEWAELGSYSPEFSFGLFPDFAVCGGSYDCGYSYTKAGAVPSGPNTDYAWGNLVAKDVGNTAHLYASPGCSIPEWYGEKASDGWTKFSSDTACDLYITTFGANEDEDLGSIEDCENYDGTTTPTTFYGWYAKLIADIKAKAPDALIIITTPSSEGIISAWATKIAAIREIAAYYELPLLRWADDTAMSTQLINYTSVTSTNHPHPTPMGYALMAKSFQRLFSRCVLANAAYFNSFR